eukprot:scaffold78748_cov72-Phaeocystis_antarctica.AAC.5
MQIRKMQCAGEGACQLCHESLEVEQLGRHAWRDSDEGPVRSGAWWLEEGQLGGCHFSGLNPERPSLHAPLVLSGIA